jgi:hypothetical protein
MVKLTAPYPRQVNAWSWAWTAGTDGKALEGPVVRADLSNADSLAKYRDKVRGAWVIQRDPASIWNPDGPAMTAKDSADRQAMMDRARQANQAMNRDTSEAAVAARRQFGIDLPYLLKQAGALGTITDGSKEMALGNMSGSPNRVSPLPNLVIAHEDYAMLDRQIKSGLNPRLSAMVDNRMGARSMPQWNTIGEIRGSELPNQVVILGAHLDSWDIGQGVTDNGTGSMVVLEAARAIAQSGLKPKRTIRFILFSGEEEGLLGSRAYAAAHAGEADNIQAVLVLDNGTGMITGQAFAGARPGLNPLAGPAGTGDLARCEQGSLGEQGRHRPPLVYPLRSTGLELRPGITGLQPYPPLPGGHLRSCRPQRPSPGLGRDGGDRV